MNATFVARLAPPLHQEGFPMRKIASLALALALLGTLAGCGKSSNATAPVTSSSSGPKTQSEAKQVAQQSATMGNIYLEQSKSLLRVATVHGARPALVRPYKGLGTAADSTSFTYALQGYDIGGNPIDWVTQGDQLASLAMDFRMYYKINRDSLLLEEDVRSHGIVAGLEAAATRYVSNATGTMFFASNAYSVGYHIISDYAGTAEVTNLAWEKSGTPIYPVAGAITQHWHGTYEYWYGAQHGTGDIVTDATITFNGTRYASVTVGTYTFTLDLETGTVS
jgi:predicted small lipoprotein YifL